MRFLPRTHAKNSGPSTTPVSTLATIHIHCDHQVSAKVRALCVLALSRPGARLQALHASRHGVTAYLRVTLTLDGPDTGPLDHLVDQLSRVPHVRDLHWHRCDTPAPGTPAHEQERSAAGACCPGAA
ncbi:hypothetical protein [Streptomyces monashensis]|uniref:MgtC-like C-terminal domain-containing protein n=1 Tax=Streptomyces monashensis TaxID=1678012 RepID=A0A1S2NZA2_9ACTN|nr:hypothetical protein [Streptomyces monashensis]OIJ86761.1 hypothetical protein BIV23_43555 [Streptomyces monashensis]